MSDISDQAQSAIQAERMARNYAAVTGLARRAYTIADIPMPDVLEAYVAHTVCTAKHEDKEQCLWVDWAFRRPDGSFRIVLENDLHRVGMTIEQSVRKMLSEVMKYKFQ